MRTALFISFFALTACHGHFDYIEPDSDNSPPERTKSMVSDAPFMPSSPPASSITGNDKGNASANNGKGGNYDKTGHSDNGKGKGRK